MKKDEKSLLCVLQGEERWPPPIWLMRQAGRYLPEYRALRAKAGSFWTLCMNPALAAEITLQPIRRFGFDAAIIFSDILTVPYALGRTVRFAEGEGPSLEPVTSAAELDENSEVWRQKLQPTYETLQRVRSQLSPGTALLGFAGAPWTLATYMAAGHGGDEQLAAKLWAYRDPPEFQEVIDILTEGVSSHLIQQLEAGADAVQIFDSWAGSLPAGAFDHWVIEPTKQIVQRVRAARPNARIIGFPRAASLEAYEKYAAVTGVSAVSVDTAVPIGWAAQFLSEQPTVVQGNLDPVALVAGKDALAKQTGAILGAMRRVPFVFNLGRGVLPETPPEHVAALVEQVRSAQ